MQRSLNCENRLNLGKKPNKNVKLSCCAVPRHGGVVWRGCGSGPDVSNVMELRAARMDSLAPDLYNEPRMIKIHQGGVK